MASAVERDRFEWVDDFEYEVTHEKPDVGFDLILKILSLQPSNHILEVFSAGPLEDLLAYHGETLIERVEKEANLNRAFANLLGGVWQNVMPNIMMGVWIYVDIWPANHMIGHEPSGVKLEFI